jgi:hypothetical protein
MRFDAMTDDAMKDAVICAVIIEGAMIDKVVADYNR